MSIDDQARCFVGRLIDIFEEILNGPPNETELSSSPLISNWTPMINDEGVALRGKISEHPDLPDQVTLTTTVLFIDLKCRIVGTISGWYRLGDRWNYKIDIQRAFPDIDVTGAKLNHGTRTVEIPDQAMHMMIASLPKILLLDCLELNETALVKRLKPIVDAWPGYHVIH